MDALRKGIFSEYTEDGQCKAMFLLLSRVALNCFFGGSPVVAQKKKGLR